MLKPSKPHWSSAPPISDCSDRKEERRICGKSSWSEHFFYLNSIVFMLRLDSTSARKLRSRSRFQFSRRFKLFNSAESGDTSGLATSPSMIETRLFPSVLDERKVGFF